MQRRCLQRLQNQETPAFIPLGGGRSFVLPPLPDKASYQSTTAQQEGDEQ